MENTEIWNKARELKLGREFLNGLDELLSCLESEKKQLIITDVGNCKRFERQDLLRAYQAGHIENLDECFTPTSMEDLKELLEDAERWCKRYTE